MMTSPVPIPNTPLNLLPAASQRTNQPPEKDDGGPFKAEMVHRMEVLAKGERILPPCDRCRRLHMDCLKNLTACMGCTKKHAKCSWKEVREDEIRGNFAQQHHSEPLPRSGIHSEGEEEPIYERASTGSPGAVMTPVPQGRTPNPAFAAGEPQHGFSGEGRVMPRGLTPPLNLQEAARSGLAHAHARLGVGDGKGAEYQTMVA